MKFLLALVVFGSLLSLGCAEKKDPSAAVPEVDAAKVKQNVKSAKPQLAMPPP